VTDADDLRELAQRLLSHPHPEGPTSIELFVQRLPNASTNIPSPPGSRLLGSALHSRRGRPTLIEAVYDAEGDSRAVLARYESELTTSGWGVFQGWGGMQGGFMPGGMTGAGQWYRQGEVGPVLMVATIDRGRATDLRLRLDWEMIRHLPEMRRHPGPVGGERMPPLHAASGIPLRGGGGGGGAGTWHSEATVETDQPVVEVESHFAGQLEQVGWVRVAGSADDVVAWSSWNLPGEGGWRGILLVLAAFGSTERFLYVRIAAADPDDGGWYSSGPMISTQC
jgi:hypothetical protein